MKSKKVMEKKKKENREENRKSNNLVKEFDNVMDTVLEIGNKSIKNDEKKEKIEKKEKKSNQGMFLYGMDLKDEYVLIYTYVAICGALGAMSRYYLSTILNEAENFPLGTFIINSLGCFLLATVYNFLGKMWHHNHRMVVGLSMGFIGAFTSFATFSMEVVKFVIAKEMAKAVAYWMCGAVAGFSGAVLGIYVTDALYQRFGGDE